MELKRYRRMHVAARIGEYEPRRIGGPWKFTKKNACILFGVLLLVGAIVGSVVGIHEATTDSSDSGSGSSPAPLQKPDDSKPAPTKAPVKAAVTKAPTLFVLNDNTIHKAVKHWAEGEASKGKGTNTYAKIYGDIEGWDTSQITDMSELFKDMKLFDADISGWNVARVTTMKSMFEGAAVFNKDLSKWDVSKVTNMASLFTNAKQFTGTGLSAWKDKVRSVTTMKSMFEGAAVFNQDLSNWNMPKVTDMSFMFAKAENFEGKGLKTWNVDNVINMANMFTSATKFNGDIRTWTFKKVKNMAQMFKNAVSFSQDQLDWAVGTVTDMNEMFAGATKFNGFVARWDVSTVTNMQGMFNHAFSFNQDVSVWNVGAVKDMSFMFASAKEFNKDVAKWNVVNVKTMAKMFTSATKFNQDVSQWKVGNVKDMTNMFNNAVSFNSIVSKWDVSKVNSASYMFSGAKTFNQDISKWNWGSVKQGGLNHILEGAGINYVLPAAWTKSASVKTDRSTMCKDVKALNLDCSGCKVDYTNVKGQCLLFKVKTSLTSDKSDTDINTVLTAWLDADTPQKTEIEKRYGPVAQWKTGDVTSMNSLFKRRKLPQDFDISKWDVSNVRDMTSMFERTTFNGDISGWNVQKVTKMTQMFYDNKKFSGDISNWNTESLTDTVGMFAYAGAFNSDLKQWKVDKVTDMHYMFKNAKVFNSDLSKWNVEKVTRMDSMFGGAEKFNGDISKWNVGKVTTMESMFEGATAFNRDLSSWDVGKVTDMTQMFQDAAEFNATISGWDVRNVEDMRYMFLGAKKFNQDIRTWDISKKTRTAMFKDAKEFSWLLEKSNTVAKMCENVVALNDDCTACSTSSKAVSYAPYKNQCVDEDKIPRKAHTNKSLKDAVKDWFSTTNGAENQKRLTKTYGPIADWKTGDVTSMKDLFWTVPITVDNTPDINGWDVRKVQSMNSMFRSTPHKENVKTNFNSDISKWKTPALLDVGFMFYHANAFTGDIPDNNRISGKGKNLASWDMSQVTNMAGMFQSAHEFNADISKWDVANVKYMSNMFLDAFKFNSDISGWKVRDTMDMKNMFWNANSFDQPLSTKWDLQKVKSKSRMFNSAAAYSWIVPWTEGTTPLEDMCVKSNILKPDCSDCINSNKVVDRGRLGKQCVNNGD